MRPRRAQVWTRALAVTACFMAGFVASDMTAADAPDAHAARTCAVPDYPGAGYFTSLTVKGVGCARGKKLALTYYRCRTKSGPGGRCKRSRVLRFKCSEKRISIQTEIDGRVRCKRGSSTVVHTYQQDI